MSIFTKKAEANELRIAAFTALFTQAGIDVEALLETKEPTALKLHIEECNQTAAAQADTEAIEGVSKQLKEAGLSGDLQTDLETAQGWEAGMRSYALALIAVGCGSLLNEKDELTHESIQASVEKRISIVAAEKLAAHGIATDTVEHEVSSESTAKGTGNIISQYEALNDPKERAAFRREHKDELFKAAREQGPQS